ncbi:MAG: protease modulator HflC [Deltaproteobacteria bacterium]|jgi:membrane protease subunit HflC|nr:protease modulator HflC [Deltaproteobacteria bacterium]
MKKNVPFIVFSLVVLFLIANGALFTVDETQLAIVLQFGEPVGEVRQPGLHFKIPIIHKVVHIDRRLMEYDVAAAEIYTRDNKNMVVDAYARWRVEDPLVFYQRFKGDTSFSVIEEAKRRLGVIIVGELRRELGLHVMADIISQNRGSIMETVTDSSNKKLSEDTIAGLSVVDVRIKRADLPPENQKAVYDRMRTEREQQATKYRSEGRRDGQKIMAETDQAVRETLANAERQSQIILGEGDSEAAAIYAEAYGQDPEFYAFKRSLDSYQQTMKDRSVIILDSGSNDYLRYFGSAEARQNDKIKAQPASSLAVDDKKSPDPTAALESLKPTASEISAKAPMEASQVAEN